MINIKFSWIDVWKEGYLAPSLDSARFLTRAYI